MAPLVRGRKGEYRKELRQLQADGFVRVRIDGEMRELGDEIEVEVPNGRLAYCIVDIAY